MNDILAWSQATLQAGGYIKTEDDWVNFCDYMYDMAQRYWDDTSLEEDNNG